MLVPWLVVAGTLGWGARVLQLVGGDWGMGCEKFELFAAARLGWLGAMADGEKFGSHALSQFVGHEW